MPSFFQDVYFNMKQRLFHSEFGLEKDVNVLKICNGNGIAFI